MIEEYKMTFKRNLKYSFLIFLFIMTAPLIGIFYFLFLPVPNIDVLFKGCLYCFAITGMFWVPGILLHLSYYFNDKQKEIRFTKAGMELSSYNTLNLIKYQSISRIEKVIAYGWRTPWNNYGFVRITANDNTVIKITCLLVDPFSLALQLSRNCDCQIEESVYGIPYFFV